MEEFAKASNPEFFIYEIIVMAWEEFKKSQAKIKKQ
jgi:hypothetical protein